MPGVNYAQRFFALLDLLRQETDARNCLDATQISTRLQEKTGLVIDPRSVRRTIAQMIEAGLPIDDAHKYSWRGVFLTREIEFLVNAVRYDYGLSTEHKRELTKKLLSLGDRRAHCDDALPERTGSPQMLDTLAVLREAMDTGKQVTFHYGSYDIGGALVPRQRRGSSGLPKVYNAHPYEIVCANGRFYLVAAVNQHVELSHYRIDRITDIVVRRAKIRPLSAEIRVEDYVLQHPYMYAGEVKLYRLRVKRDHLNDVYDWFGQNTACENASDTHTDVLVHSDASSMRCWLKRYGEYAQLLETTAPVESTEMMI